MSRDVGLASIVVGVALAFALAFGGAALPIGWAFSVVALGALAWARRGETETGERDATLAGYGLGVHLSFAIAHLLLFDAPAEDLLRGGRDPGAIEALLAISVSALLGARLVAEDRDERERAPNEVSLRQLLDFVGLAALGLLSAYVLSDSALVLAYVAEASTLAAIARRTADRLALTGGVAFLGAAVAHVLAFDAPLDARATGVEDLASAALAVAAVCGGAFACVRQVSPADGRLRDLLGSLGAAAAVYLPSIAIVTVFQPNRLGAAAGLLDLGVRQQGQVLLSGLWSLIGLAALTAGLVRDDRRLRLGGFALLGLALAKVFAYDLQTLDSIYRVLSFLALGLLLLAAAFLYQGIRPGGAGAETAPTDPRRP